MHKAIDAAVAQARQLARSGRRMLFRRVGTKLVSGFLVVLAMAGLIGWVGINVASDANDRLDNVISDHLNELNRLADTSDLMSRDHDAALEYANTDDKKWRADRLAQLDSLDGQISEFISGRAEDHSLVAQEMKLVQDLDRSWKAFLLARGYFLTAADRHEGAVSLAISDAFETAFDMHTKVLGRLRDFERKQASELHAATEVENRAGRLQVLVTMLAAFVVGMGIAIFLARGLASGLKAVGDAARKVAAGDLTGRAVVKSHDEIAQLASAFNSMAVRLETMVVADREIKESLEAAVVEYSSFAAAVANGDLTARVAIAATPELEGLTSNLNGMVKSLGGLSGEVAAGAVKLGGAASQILKTVHEQSATISEQSAAISQTSVTVDELRASAEQAAHKALEVAREAQTSVTTSDEGTAVVSEIVAGMEQIRSQVEAIASNIVALSEQTQQISELTSTVDDIAEQSNLLALNAAIEAARAGEHGKGFAVVASEVRNLAEQSKAGTSQVRTILADIQRATAAAVMATEQGTKVVAIGRDQARRAGASIDVLATTIRSTAQSAQQIAAAAQQQSVAVDQIADAMTDINSGVQSFVTGSADATAAASSLNTLAEELQAHTSSYLLLPGPKSSNGKPSVADF